MAQEINIVGKDNTRAEVTGQNELLVKIGGSLVRVPNIIRTSGPLPGTIVPIVYDFSVANVGLANGTILGINILPGETLSFNAGAMNNYYAANSIAYDGTGTELVIIFNS